jgi:hypothetical protein
VGVAEEVSGVDDLSREIEGVVVKQDGAENGAFRLEVVRQRAFSTPSGDIVVVLSARLGGLRGLGEPKARTTSVNRP